MLKNQIDFIFKKGLAEENTSFNTYSNSVANEFVHIKPIASSSILSITIADGSFSLKDQSGAIIDTLKLTNSRYLEPWLTSAVIKNSGCQLGTSQQSYMRMNELNKLLVNRLENIFINKSGPMRTPNDNYIKYADVHRKFD
ncbi:hypothetical protein [Photobacterium leiognathi]|uniref:hypothetical protein n=1 Tax=Photobacterium leiognathi TaxID=553611 RepID=UPI002980E9A1|nr:hypothetical protein [Photobacterium leiognathi]